MRWIDDLQGKEADKKKAVFDIIHGCCASHHGSRFIPHKVGAHLCQTMYIRRYLI
jgi:hypothetical protein